MIRAWSKGTDAGKHRFKKPGHRIFLVRVGHGFIIDVMRFLFGVLFFTFGLWPDPKSCAALVWEEDLHSISMDLEQTSAEVAYRFRNQGDRAITIQEIKADCSCVKAKSDKQVYEPGEAGVIEVTYSPGARTGKQRSRVIVRSTDETMRIRYLGLEVELPQPIAVLPDILVWRRGQREQALEAKIVLENPEMHRVESATPTSPAFEVRVEPMSKPGEYRLIVTPQDFTQARKGRVQIKTNYPQAKRAEKTVFLWIR